MQVAVGHDQGRVTARRQFPILVKDNTLPVRTSHICIIRSVYGNITRFRGGLAEDFNHSAVGGQVHILISRHRLYIRTVVADLNIAVFYMHVYTAGLGIHGLIYRNVAAVHGHLYIIRCHHVAFSVFANQDVAGIQSHSYIVPCDHIGAYRNIARLHVHLYVVACGYIRAYRHVARLHIHLYIVACGYIGAYRNVSLHGGLHTYICTGGYALAYVDVTRTRGQINRTVLSRNGLTNVNIAGFRLHGHVIVHGNIGRHGDIALPLCFHIQVPSRGHMVCYEQVAVGHDQGRVTARCKPAVLVKDNVLPVFTFHIVVVGGMYGNIARLRGGLAGNPDLSAFRRQVHIPSGRHRLHVRTVVADLDIAVLYQHIHITAFGLHSLIHGNIAAGNGQRHMIARNHVTLAVAAAYPDVARACGHGYIPACVDILSHIDAAVLRLHGDILAHGDVFIYIDTAFFTGFGIIAAPCGNLVCHMDVAVHHDHVGIPAGLHLTVMVDDNVLAGFTRYVIIISSQ